MNLNEKSNEELVILWNGNFQSDEQLSALRKLAERGVKEYQDILKEGLQQNSIRIVYWTDFRYINDIDFVIDYVNNPQKGYEVDEAFCFLDWISTDNDFIPAYNKLSDACKDALLQYILKNSLHHVNRNNDYIRVYNQLSDSNKDALLQYILEHELHRSVNCFEIFMDMRQEELKHRHPHYIDENFDHVVARKCGEYNTFLHNANDTKRLAKLNIEIEKYRQELWIGFQEWLFGKHVNIGTLGPYGMFEYDCTCSYLLPKLQNILQQVCLQPLTLPKVVISYKRPPLFIQHPDIDKEENPNPWQYVEGHADTEELLGCYIPSKKRIELYEVGIQYVANLFKVSADKLRDIVLIHELGHYMQHLMPCFTTTQWNTRRYNASYNPKHLLEAWAQLMDEWVVRGDTDSDYEQIFDRLVCCQSAPYREFKNYIPAKYPQYTYPNQYYKKFFESIDGLRSISNKATIADWNALL